MTEAKPLADIDKHDERSDRSAGILARLARSMFFTGAPNWTRSG